MGRVAEIPSVAARYGSGSSSIGNNTLCSGSIGKVPPNGIFTASISCNPDSPVAAVSDIAIEAVTGPEFVTGSTRMKAGTAQKMILNMITTAVMIKIGRVKGNRMINMQLTSEKLIERGTRMIIDETGMEYDTARRLLFTYGSVGAALDSLA